MPLPKTTIVLAAILTLLIIAAAGLYYLKLKTGPESLQVGSTKQPLAVVTEPEMPEPPYVPKRLPGGIQTYNFSHASTVKGPRPLRATINTLVPKPGETQTIQLQINSEAEVTQAKVRLHTDNQNRDYPLTLIDGNRQNGVWTGSWTTTDTYERNYYLQFNLQSAAGTFDGGLRFRQ